MTKLETLSKQFVGFDLFVEHLKMKQENAKYSFSRSSRFFYILIMSGGKTETGTATSYPTFNEASWLFSIFSAGAPAIGIKSGYNVGSKP